jgi:hypothetical protein
MRYYENNDRNFCDVGEILSEEELYSLYNILGLDVTEDGQPLTSVQILEDFVENHDGVALSITEVIRRRL